MTQQVYRHLLLAVDFAPESEVVIERALAVRDAFGARLTLVNVVEYVPPGTEYAGGAFVAEFWILDVYKGADILASVMQAERKSNWSSERAIFEMKDR